MDNSNILKFLEKQRDDLFIQQNSTSISELHKQQYDGIKSGEMYVLGDEKEEMLEELKILSNGTSYDKAFKEKLKEYLKLDNNKLIGHFCDEFLRVFQELNASNKLKDIQAIFIEYDYYYHYDSCIQCYGENDYPLLQEPQYLFNRLSNLQEVLMLQNVINFEPAWVDCDEFEELEPSTSKYRIGELISTSF